MAKPVRKLVTGTDTNGRPVFVSDELVPAWQSEGTHPEGGVHPTWGSNAPVELPTSGEHFDFDPPFPPAGGFRTYLFRVVPESWLSGGVRMMGAGMHQTHTVDIGYVIEGEVWLELEGGEERLLQAGDVIVQNGTNHAWHNRGDEVCTMSVTVVAAAPQSPAE